jgi:FtsP/CotA-like multicopper oxidase with cupredoxin domain
MKKLVILSLLTFLILLQLARADITTDKETYKPEETIDIRLSSANDITEVALYIINPIGTQEFSETSMVNNQFWEYNYTLGTNAINGTYVINMIASEGGSLSENSTKFYFSKNFDVVTTSDFSANPDVINETVSEITEDYSFIIWTFAIFIVVVIVTITILRYRKIRKKKSQEKKKIDEEKKKEDAYYKSQEEYRTEYY